MSDHINTQPSEVPEALTRASKLCRSTIPGARVELIFQNLEDAQAVHKWLVSLKASPVSPSLKVEEAAQCSSCIVLREALKTIAAKKPDRWAFGACQSLANAALNEVADLYERPRVIFDAGSAGITKCEHCYEPIAKAVKGGWIHTATTLSTCRRGGDKHEGIFYATPYEPDIYDAVAELREKNGIHAAASSPSDAVRKAAEEIVDELFQHATQLTATIAGDPVGIASYSPNYVIEKCVAIISRHLPATVVVGEPTEQVEFCERCVHELMRIGDSVYCIERRIEYQNCKCEHRGDVSASAV